MLGGIDSLNKMVADLKSQSVDASWSHVQELRQLLRQQSSASSAALDAGRAAAAQQANESAAAAAESAQEAAAAALHAAEVRAALLEGQLEVAEQERDALLKQVGRYTVNCHRR
jgi:hypothetical protein